MKLTDKEMEIMVVLWGNERPMTAAEVVEASNNRTWKENSIYIFMNSLIKKGAVISTRHKPTMTNNARAYKPAITSEEYTISYIKNMKQTGVQINIPALVERLMNTEEG
jgi:predicted transcriptional regulator